MRTFTRTFFAAVLAATLFAAAPVMAQLPFDPTKFYVHVPITAAGHNAPMLNRRKPFDTLTACEAFIRDDAWRADESFAKTVLVWMDREAEEHDGDVEFGKFFCWSPIMGPPMRQIPKPEVPA